MIEKRSLSWLIPLVLIVTFPLWKIPVGNFLAPRGGIDETMTRKQEKVEQSFSMQNSVIRQFKNDQLTAVVHSATVATGDKPETFQLTGITAQLYDEKRNQTDVVAGEGSYNSTTEFLVLKKGVVLDRKIDQQKLFTEHLNYDGLKQTLESPTTTRVETPDAEIQGGSFSYNLKEGTYRFDKRVNVTLRGVKNQE